ncbi:MAG: hypothetical protein HYS13_01845 [Planctomycetia bacterium]|nr:hypothetical protein [Planctomycetia bacterium]
MLLAALSISGVSIPGFSSGLGALGSLLGLVAPEPAPEPTEETAATAKGDLKLSALRKAAEQHDLANISLLDFADLVRDLYEEGALSLDELRDLAAIHAEAKAAGEDVDAPRDVVAMLAAKVQSLRSQTRLSPSAPALAAAERQLDWATKFQALRAVSAPLDLVA